MRHALDAWGDHITSAAILVFIDIINGQEGLRPP
jgi:hypothetical protein